MLRRWHLRVMAVAVDVVGSFDNSTCQAECEKCYLIFFVGNLSFERSTASCGSVPWLLIVFLFFCHWTRPISNRCILGEWLAWMLPTLKTWTPTKYFTKFWQKFNENSIVLTTEWPFDSSAKQFEEIQTEWETWPAIKSSMIQAFGFRPATRLEFGSEPARKA